MNKTEIKNPIGSFSLNGKKATPNATAFVGKKGPMENLKMTDPSPTSKEMAKSGGSQVDKMKMTKATPNATSYSK